MRTCIRTRNKGGCYFFTVNLAERPGDGLLVRHVDHLRSAFRETRADHPFMIDAIVILPDHLHCIWQLPPDDDDYPTRWRLINSGFRVDTNERVSESRQRKHERGLWQRRFGNMRFVMMRITGNIWIIFITIRSSMDLSNPRRIGIIHPFGGS